MKKNKGMILAFVLPGTILLLATFIYPIVRTVFMSFFSIKDITDSFSQWKFKGLGNYSQLLGNGLYVQSWINLFKIFIIGGIITLGISLILAVIIEGGVKAKGFWQTAVYLPNIISGVAMATMWIQYVFNPSYGLLRNFFRFLHLDGLANIQWFDSSHKFWAMLISYCFGMIGHNALIWISGLKKISPEFYEAASIDGASKFKQFTKVTLPLLKGTLKTNITMWSISVSGFFLWSMLFSPLSADNNTVVPMVYMYQKLFGVENAAEATRDAGSGAAVGVMLCAFVVIVFNLAERLLKSDDLEF